MMNPQDTSVRSSQFNFIGQLVPNVLINAVCPFIIYSLVNPYMSMVAALLLSAIPPILYSLVNVIRERRVSPLSIIVLLGIAFSLITAFLLKDPKLLLLRDSAVTGLLGLVFLVSLPFPRPLTFYLGMDMTAHNDPARRAQFYARWQNSQPFRSSMFLLTAIWGCTLLTELLLRVALIYTLSIPAFLLFAPIIGYAIYTVVGVWTTWYIRGVRAKFAQANPPSDE
jgi:hypothetical protein